MAKHLSNRRVALCAWLADNGISPNDVPQDADITIDKGPTGRFLRCEVYDRDKDGHLQTDVATMVVNVPLKVDPPEWWQPQIKPTRDELLEVLSRVQQLTERWKYTADRKGGPRQELLQCLGDYAVPPAP